MPAFRAVWISTALSPTINVAAGSTPASVIRIEEQIGADIIMPLDVCVGYPTSRADTELALERTHAWALRAAA